ncbi:hypothetical protein [Microvirga terrestris]|uniref:Uncharacterized protein n=1 Tax=Microvirga terrestris TaxID=2791024 RepID=A0ABS0HWQ7_9HYPH|nr:hypothetical protein [Microvirga terrestris]MBF9197944.1 hypothetical protein [Microvirga terrestris]
MENASEALLPVLTNQPGIDISATPPEFSSDELQSQKTPTLPRFLDLGACLGLDQRSDKVLICGKSHERQYTAALHGSSDEREKVLDRYHRSELSKRRGQYDFCERRSLSLY